MKIKKTDIIGGALQVPTSMPGWTAWTPTITAGAGTITSYTSFGFYTQVGTTVFVTAWVNIITNGTGSGWINITNLPKPVTPTSTPVILLAREVLLSGTMCTFTANAGTTNGAIVTYNNGYPGGNGNGISINGFYETNATAVPVVSTVT